MSSAVRRVAEIALATTITVTVISLLTNVNYKEIVEVKIPSSFPNPLNIYEDKVPLSF